MRVLEREEFLQDLIEDNDNDWGGGDSLETLLESKYAVVVERDEDSWVVGAENEQDVANIALSCMHAEYYTEYISEIYEVETCEEIIFATETEVTVWIFDQPYKARA